MTTRLKRPMLVLGTTILVMQAVFMPIGMVYAEPTTEPTEQEQVELAHMKNYLEEEQGSDPRFFFTRSRMEGTVEAPVQVAFFSDQEVSEARVILPEEATLIHEQLATGVSVMEGAQPREWLVQSERPQNTFVLPLVFEKTGSYELTVEEATAQLEISEQEEASEEVPAEETEASDEEPVGQEEPEDSQESKQPEEEVREPVVEAPQEQQTDEEKTDEVSEAIEPTVFDGETAEVNSFEELRLAIENSEVGTIEVRSNLTRSGTGVATAIGSLNRSVVIKGNGFTINFGADNGSLGLTSLAEDAQETIRVENATITKTGATPIFNAADTGKGWTLEMEDITEGTANAARLALLPEGSVVFTGGTNNFIRTAVTNVFLQAQHIEVRGGAQVTINRGNSWVLLSNTAYSKLTVRENAMLSITTASGTGVPIEFRGANSEINVINESHLNVQTQGTTAVPTNTTNNAIALTGIASKMHVNGGSRLTVTSTSAKRGVHFGANDGSMSVVDSEVSITSATQSAVNMIGNNPEFSAEKGTIRLAATTGAAIHLAGEAPKVQLTASTVNFVTTTGDRVNLIGATPQLMISDTALTMTASTGRGIFLQGATPQVVVDASQLVMTDTGASQGMILQGTDALLSLRNNSAFEVTGAGTGTTQNIAIGDNSARPTLSITEGSKLSVRTTSGTAAATATTNNAVHLRGAEPKATITGESELSVSMTSGARRGVLLTGEDAEVTVADSQFHVTTVSGQSLNLTGSDPTVTMNKSTSEIVTTTGAGMHLAGDNSFVEINESELSIQSTTGQRMNLIGSNPILDVSNSQLTMTASTGQGIFLQGATPQVVVDASQLVMTDTGASQGMILQGTDALLSLKNNSEFELIGAGTGTTENIQIGNNNARPELSVTGESKLSVTTTSGTAAATATTNNAVHLRGAEPKVTIKDGSALSVSITSGARRGVFLNGIEAEFLVADSQFTVDTLTGRGIEILGNNGKAYLTASSKVTMTSTTGNNILMQGNNAILTVDEATKLNTTSGAADSVRLIGNAPTLKIRGEGTELNAASHHTTNANASSTIFVGNDNTEVRMENYLVSVGDHAKLTVTANVSSALLMQGNLGRFDVSNQAEIQLVSGSYNTISTGASNASLRFMRSGPDATAGGNTFNIDNATMDLRKGGGNAAAVRMYGSNNQINVLNKGEFFIENPGTGTGLDAGTSGSNQGIHYTGTTSNNNSFSVSDPGSLVKINAASGAAIDMQTANGNVRATNGGYFEASGRTATAAAGIFNANTLTIDFDNPLFMDFRNNRSGGGNIFNNTAASILEATNSDLSVWRNGSNLDGDPDINFSTLNYSFTGTNFNTLATTNQPDILNTETFGTTGLTAYSRMSSNNARWVVVDELRVPTNADKKIHGHVSIPVGLEDKRSAWDDEATVVVEVERSNGSIEEYVTKTVGYSNDEPGISIYGEEPRGGLFEINLQDYLQKGDKVRIKEAYLTSGELSQGYENIILTDTVEVFPIIPPTPAQFSSSTIAQDSSTIQGRTDDQKAEVTATHNGEPLDTEDVVVASDGTFTLDLSEVVLEEDDEIQVFLRDMEGSAAEAGVVNPPETNNTRGNINSSKEHTFRDSTFAPATILTVSDLGPVSPVDPLDPETEVDPENKPELPENQGLLSLDFASQFNFGSQAISAKDEVYFAQPQRLLNEDGTVNQTEERPNYVQVTDRRSEAERNGWQLAVTQNKQFETSAGHELAGARLRLTNQQLATAQGGSEPEFQQTNPLALVPGQRRVLLMAEGEEGTGTWVYRFGDQATAGESVALEVPRGATPEATTYKTTLTWELSAIPDN